jgi:hypothetical protein
LCALDDEPDDDILRRLIRGSLSSSSSDEGSDGTSEMSGLSDGSNLACDDVDESPEFDDPDEGLELNAGKDFVDDDEFGAVEDVSEALVLLSLSLSAES